jgi:nucleotide-binding universal stress UspA family protein
LVCLVLLSRERQVSAVSARVLLSYDGSQPGQRAFEYVLKLPPERRAELAILAVMRSSAFAWDFGVQSLIEGASRVLEERIAQLERRAQFAGTPTTAMVRIGHPVQEIIRAAREWHADLIVTAYRGHFPLVPRPWDSMSNRVRAQAPCAVVIVR